MEQQHDAVIADEEANELAESSSSPPKRRRKRHTPPKEIEFVDLKTDDERPVFPADASRSSSSDFLELQDKILADIFRKRKQAASPEQAAG